MRESVALAGGMPGLKALGQKSETVAVTSALRQGEGRGKRKKVTPVGILEKTI